MYKEANNYAFIDGNNIHLSAVNLGWKISHHKFRKYLAEKYCVKVAYYFIGYLEKREDLYANLSRHGFQLIYKDVSRDDDGNIKGNIDSNLVLQAMADINNYDKAVIVSSDGDFACLVDYLKAQNKFHRVLASSRSGCSKLLSVSAGADIDFLDELKNKLEYKK